MLDRGDVDRLDVDAADSARSQHDPSTCQPCRGTGFCVRCKGNGRYAVRGTKLWVDCMDCAGSGECPECNGTGRVLPEAEDE